MFVIVQCLNNQKDLNTKKGTPIPDLIGAALKHGGVSITVTSVTDVLAFGVGAVTVSSDQYVCVVVIILSLQAMPGLQSFCVCTALGLASIYALQCGWFVAWLALDEERVRAAKNGCVPCVRHVERAGDQMDKEVVQKTVKQYVMTWYRALLSSTVYRVVIVLTSLCCLAFGVWGFTLIRYKFDPFLLLPSDSYLSRFISLTDEYYDPYRGWAAEVYTGGFNHTDLARIDTLVMQLEILKQQELYIKGKFAYQISP